jgi:CRP-like cAMP-binding protein
MAKVKTAPISLKTAKSRGRLENRILCRLPEAELDDLSPHIELLSLSQGHILHEQGETMRYAYFFNSGLDSTVAIMNNGQSTEVAVTGKEGFLGAPLLLGVNSTPYRALVQVSGEAISIPAEKFVECVNRNEKLRWFGHRFLQAHTVQIMQTSACNRLHEADQRLARWLLLAQDRLGNNYIPLTQEFLATMLGIRRESVGIAIKALEKRKCIDSRRGLLTITDRDGLEKASCECYRIVRSEFDRLLFNDKF